MRSLPISLAVLMVFVALAGCQKPKAPQQRTVYDQNLDGASPLAMPVPDESLTKSGNAGRPAAASAAATASPAVASTGDAVKDVQAVLAEMKKTATGPAPETVAQYYVPEISKFVAPVMISIKKAETAKKKAEEAIKTKLDDATFAKLATLDKDSGMDMSLKGPDTDWANADVTQFKVEPAGKDMKVSDAAGKPVMLFKQVDGKWLAAPTEMSTNVDPKLLEKVMDLMVKATDAASEVYTAIAEGVTGGTITVENFDAQYKQIADQKMKPVMELMGPIMAEMMAEAMKSATSGPATMSAEAGSTTTTADASAANPTAGTGDTPPAEANTVLTSVSKALASETPETASESFIPEQASTFTTFLTAQKNLRTAQTALEKAIKAKLTDAQAQELQKAMEKVMAANPLPLADISSAKFQSAAGEYRFRDAEGKKLEMVARQPAGKWVVGFPDPAKQFPALTSYGEMLGTVTTMMQSMASNVDSGMPADMFSQALSAETTNLTPAIEAVKKAVADAGTGTPTAPPAQP